MPNDVLLFVTLKLDSLPAQSLYVFPPEGVDVKNGPFVVIEQSASSHKTHILSVSPMARQLGIKEGMPFFRARKKVPGLTVCKRSKEAEKKLWQRVGDLCYQLTPLTLSHAGGTVTMDLSQTPASRRYNYRELAEGIRGAVFRECGVYHVALGVSSSYVVSQVICKMAAPDGIKLCQPGQENQVLSMIDIHLVPGLSAHCRERLKKFGVKTIGQLQHIPTGEMLLHFGAEGEKLFALARGFALPFAQSAKKKPVKAEYIIPKDVNDKSYLDSVLVTVVDKFCFELKKSSLFVTRFSLVIFYTDGKKTRRTLALPRETHDFEMLEAEVRRAFFEMLGRRVAIKKITLSTVHFRAKGSQLDMLVSRWGEKQERIGYSLFKIRQKHRFDAVLNGAGLLQDANHK